MHEGSKIPFAHISLFTPDTIPSVRTLSSPVLHCGAIGEISLVEKKTSKPAKSESSSMSLSNLTNFRFTSARKKGARYESPAGIQLECTTKKWRRSLSASRTNGFLKSTPKRKSEQSRISSLASTRFNPRRSYAGIPASRTCCGRLESSSKGIGDAQGEDLLCVPPFARCMLDQGITLVGQAPDYWAGNRSVANEGNPWFLWLLRQHPLAFEAGITAWVVVFSLVILAVPRHAAMTVSIAIVLGHTWGAATWICWVLPYGYWIALALFLVSAVLIVAAWERFGQRMARG